MTERILSPGAEEISYARSRPRKDRSSVELCYNYTVLYLGHFVEGNSGLKGRTLQSYSIAHHVSHWRLRPGSFSTDSVELKLFSSDAAVHSYFGSGPKLRSRNNFFLVQCTYRKKT